MKYDKSNKWEAIYSEFERYFPSISNMCVDWWPGGYEKITVQLNDGGRMIFDNTHKTIRNVTGLKEHVEDGKEEWKSEFCRRLRINMHENNCDQEKLSRLIGVSQGTVSNYLTGKSLPDLWVMLKICEVLNTPIESFLYFE